MAGLPNKFVKASQEAVREGLREGHWIVYRHYCAVGPRGVVSCTGGADPKLIQELNSAQCDPATAAGGGYIVAPTFLKDTSELDDAEDFWEYINAAEAYAPLTYPDVFLDFAQLAEEGEITLEAMLEWVELYGVLGLEGRQYRDLDPRAPDASGGPADSLENFAIEARKANGVLRLYEAATDPGGPDVEKMIGYAERTLSPALLERYWYQTDDPVMLRIAVLEWVAGTVRWMVAADCYPELYQDGDEFHQGFGFRSLLGAMYLQMVWLMTAKGGVRRCQAPKCSNIIAFESPEESDIERLERLAEGRPKQRKTYTNKIYCSSACKQRAYDYKKRLSKRSL